VEQRHVKCMVFGPWGSGKTWFLGSASLDERTAPLLYLDFEGGDLTLDGMPGEGDTWVRFPVRDWKDYNEAYEEAGSGKYRSAGIDSLSETHVGALLIILEENAGRRRDDDALEIQDYGKALIQMRKFVRHWRDLPIHVFMSSHAKDEARPRAGLVTVPSLPGKAAIEIPGMLDVVAYLSEAVDEDDKAMRTLLLRNYPKIQTKVRTPWGLEIPDEIDNPTVAKLLDTLNY
jgi:hypothetical protein